MHFHPLGIPLDELVFAAWLAFQTPPAMYVQWARAWLYR